MKTGLHGWCGQILKVDLSIGRTSAMDTEPYADRFLGGRGVATRIYWEEVLPGSGAFDPENRLIFMTGPLVATGTQGAARCMVIGKSPMLMPEGFCYGERIFNLQHAILLREGLQPEKDDFPAEFNFTNPVKEIYLNPDVIVPYMYKNAESTYLIRFNL